MNDGEKIKTNNDNGQCYKKLNGYEVGDVFEYVSSRGITRHYVISFLHTRMERPFATILFPDGYAETAELNALNELKDKKIRHLDDWSTIRAIYEKEAKMYE